MIAVSHDLRERRVGSRPRSRSTERRIREGEEAHDQNADKGYHRCQFTFACDGRTDAPGERQAWSRSADLAQNVYAEFALGQNVGAVPGSALYYHTTNVNPSWSNTYNAVAQIGSHIFYSPN